jgi:PPK2 family polyphosphate:nucleotide phosphotransferase
VRVAKGRHDRAAQLADRFRVDRGKGFRLRDVNPGETGGIRSKGAAAAALQQGVARLAAMQEMLYAQDRWALLLIFQAMDAAGKDGAIKHVMSGVNPQGCQVFSFKSPSAEELDHDYLWRTSVRLPERGRIGIFNRSYYEEVLIVRVHPDILAAQRLPRPLVTAGIWAERYEDINAFERYLTRNGVAIRKFFLHVSRDEQEQRFLQRLEQPEKNWKFSLADVRERQHWDEYMQAYEEAIRATATPHAPWYVVPADHKWFARLVIASAIVDALADLDLAYPQLDAAKRRELQAARAELRAQHGPARRRVRSGPAPSRTRESS